MSDDDLGSIGYLAAEFRSGSPKKTRPSSSTQSTGDIIRLLDREFLNH